MNASLIPSRDAVPNVSTVMLNMSPPIAAVLGVLDQPRAQSWLTAGYDADPYRMKRLADAGLVQRAVGFVWPRRWVRTPMGDDWCRVWAEEMDRRRAAADRTPMWLEGEEPQPGDTVIVHDTGVPGMRSGVRIVPHNARAVDVPYEPPADMVEALRLLDANGGEPVSVNYLVGSCAVATDAARMQQILATLQSMGLAVQQGHGWVRTVRGSRMYQTWSGAEGSAV